MASIWTRDQSDIPHLGAHLRLFISMIKDSLVAMLMAFTCSSVYAQAAEDGSPHQVHKITVQNGVTLEVLDCGGKGPPIVMLAGLGDTAHVFDTFAPKLTARKSRLRNNAPRLWGLKRACTDIKQLLSKPSERGHSRSM